MEITLKATPRTERGKGPARRARAEGKVPGVVYGSKVEASPLFVDAREMDQALKTEAGLNVLINLKLDSKTTHFTVPREIQRHALRGNVLHVDFLAIDRDVKLEAVVPVHLIGESKGVKEGGAVEHHLWELKVEALPGDLPPSFDVDISALGIGDHMRVEDIKAPDGVEILDEPSEIVASVVEPQVIELPEDIVEEGELEEGEVPEGEEAAASAEGEEAGDEAAAEKEDSSD
jgi:large subunit ribosomal protein L25